MSILRNEILPKLNVTRKELAVHKEEILDWKELDELVQKSLTLYDNKEAKIGILPDVDVDGLMSFYIVHDIFQRFGFKNIKWIINPGKKHGVIDSVVDWAIKEEFDYLFIPDAGSGDVENLNKIAENTNTIVYVLDHHPYKNDTPLHKNVYRLNCIDNQQIPELSGAGVTYRFFEALEYELNTGYDMSMYEKFVGLSVISDMCNMLDKENRYYVFKLFQDYKLVPFFAKFKFYGSKSSLFGFSVAPYLNKLIRIGEEKKAVEVVLNMNSNIHFNDLEYERVRVTIKSEELQKKLLESSKIIRRKGLTFLLRTTLPELNTMNGILANTLIGEYDTSMLVLYYNSSTSMWGGSFRGKDFPNSELKKYGFECFGHDLACGSYISNTGIQKFLSEWTGDYSVDDSDVSNLKYLYEVDDFSDIRLMDWKEIAYFNEMTGTNLPRISIKIRNYTKDDGESMVMPSNPIHRTLIFENEKVTEFFYTTPSKLKDKEVIVIPTLSNYEKRGYQLLMR